jgi:alkaline phosphatase D
MYQLIVLALLAIPALASFGSNLNYRSPSLHHPGLGISLRKVVKRNDPSSSFNSSQLNFTHGVASGDPYPNSVILWTRLSPVFDDIDANVTVSGVVPLFNPVPIYNGTDEHLPPSNAPVCLNWAVSSDPNVTQIVSQGTVYTSSDVDYTVKVEAAGLQPFTRYYYQFSTCDSQVKSIIGRTKTTPNPTDDTTSVSLAIYSCSNFPFGFFNAYGNPVRKDSVDYVIHLGDYIYEYANGDYGWGQSINRIPLPDRTIYTLYDYRKRHATYRTDADLVLSHANYPWIPVWDDHEVADNTYKDASSELNNTEASFIADGGVAVDQRKMNAVRAYFEWMPLRQVEMDDSLRIWRSFAIGNLVDLIMLDTRQYNRDITDLYWNTDYIHAISNDAGRSMMGPRQEYWFYDSLKQSAARGATWRLIGSQTVFSRLNESEVYGNVNPLDYDAWDGYQANRNRTLSTLYDNGINNNIVISGDSHANWVSDLVWLDSHDYNSSLGTGSVGVEFAGTAVSSPSPRGQNITIGAANNHSRLLVEANEELQWSEVYYRGYFELHFSKEEVQAQYFGLPTIVRQDDGEIALANFTVAVGENRLKRFEGAGGNQSTVEGGVVENGFLRGGMVVQTNLTNATGSGMWYVSEEPVEDL